MSILARPKRSRPERRINPKKTQDKRRRMPIPKRTINLKEIYQRDNHTYYTFEFDIFQCVLAHTDDGGVEQGWYGFYYRMNHTYFHNNLENHKVYPDMQNALNILIMSIGNEIRTKIRYKRIGNVRYKIV